MNPARLFNPLLATAAVSSLFLMAGTASATVEGFENPTLLNGTAMSSGTDIANYVGPLGTWKDTNTAGATAPNNIPALVNGGTSDAYAGNWYFHMADQGSAFLTGATLTLNPASQIAVSGSRITFALRDDGSFNSNQIVINSLTGGTTTRLLQIGLQNTSTGTQAATGRITATPTGGSNATLFTGITSGHWYVFVLDYTITGTTGSYKVTVTDGSNNNAAVYSNTLTGNASLISGTAYTYSSLVTSTNSTYIGSADMDGLSFAVAPEPASMGLFGAAGVAVLLKRRRRLAII